ncbi:hypothetical protein Pmani_000643 [Petrolisthes manimaculis]|uniref:Innexin n=1 Tax=Petrolisthes manimaculis TaxID=1843537 RepID=A0AAE1QM28_9EUCA|nr:hypothetical protein Pmani_000643 [Petrolisthes manimaculis]
MADDNGGTSDCDSGEDDDVEVYSTASNEADDADLINGPADEEEEDDDGNDDDDVDEDNEMTGNDDTEEGGVDDDDDDEEERNDEDDDDNDEGNDDDNDEEEGNNDDGETGNNNDNDDGIEEEDDNESDGNDDDVDGQADDTLPIITPRKVNQRDTVIDMDIELDVREEPPPSPPPHRAASTQHTALVHSEADSQCPNHNKKKGKGDSMNSGDQSDTPCKPSNSKNNKSNGNNSNNKSKGNRDEAKRVPLVPPRPRDSSNEDGTTNAANQSNPSVRKVFHYHCVINELFFIHLVSNDEPNIVKNVVEPLKKLLTYWTKKQWPQPVDSAVLRLHYRMGVCLFLIAYQFTQGNWFLRESVHCVNLFNAETAVKPFHQNICLSYPFVCEDKMDFSRSSERGECPGDRRRYILFYRWIHFSFLVLAGLYYLPRMVAKKVDDPRLQKLIKDMAEGEKSYDGSSWKQDTEVMVNYMEKHLHTHSHIYFWFVFTHLLALTIDVATVYFFNFILQDQFLTLMYSAYPYQRNPQNFTDYLSSTFPPFVLCRLDKNILINNERVENLACHLLLMELYEKMFIVLWVWLAVVTVCTTLIIICQLLATLPPFWGWFLHLHSNSSKIRELKRKVLKLCDVGDLYVLYLLKKHRSDAQFVMFMSKLTHIHDVEKVEHKHITTTQKRPDKGNNHQDIDDVLWEEPRHSVDYGWTTTTRPSAPAQLPSYYTQASQQHLPRETSYQDHYKKRDFLASTPNKQTLPPQQLPQSRKITFSDRDSYFI